MIPNTPDPRTPTTALSSADQAPILAYLKAGKSDFFTLNEEVKGDDKSELCRGELGKDCLEVKQAISKVFALMTTSGYYCALPMRPSDTHFDCTKIAAPEVRK